MFTLPNLMKKKITAVIFDLGGVFIGWDPVSIYVDVFDGDHEKAQWFINHICTMDWNEAQDAGRSIEEGTRLKIKEFPQHEHLIRKYYDDWENMLTGTIDGTIRILEQLQTKNEHQLFALTNWSAETFPVALERYSFLQIFEDIVVSGKIKMKKPDSKIYQYSLKQFNLLAENALFIDDNLRNVEAARKEGIHSIHFISPQQLEQELIALGILGVLGNDVY